MSCGGSFDLLGAIMQGQNLLNTSADKIVIKRDGKEGGYIGRYN